MIPLQKIFDWGGEKLGDYLGKDLKDLLVITLSKYVFTDPNSCDVSLRCTHHSAKVLSKRL